MPQNDGSETQELFHSNISEIAFLQTKLNLAKGLSTDAYRQLGDSLRLLGECRDLLEIVALESPLRKDIQALIAKIDEFYPQVEEFCPACDAGVGHCNGPHKGSDEIPF